MSSRANSTYLSILKATSITGLSSVASVVFGLVKMKFAAILLGPTGMGLIGIIQSVMGVFTIVGDMGMRQAWAKEIARKRGEGKPAELAAAIRLLLIMGAVLAVGTGAIFFLLQDFLVSKFIGTALTVVDWWLLTLAIMFTIAAGSLTGLLNGYRHVADLGRVVVASSFISTIIAVVAVLFWRDAGITLFILSAPMFNFVFCAWYSKKIKVNHSADIPPSNTLNQLNIVFKLGIFVMLSALVTAGAELAVRSTIQIQLGVDILGFFTAAWIIGSYYLNFLMTATAYDFFPRMSSGYNSEADRTESINVQIETLLLISGPIFVAITTFAPIVLKVLYSEEFLPAANLLRLMVFGDILRLTFYPLSFVLLSVSAGKNYFAAKAFEAATFFLLVIILVPPLGLTGVGIAYIATFIFLLPIMVFLVRSKVGFIPARTPTVMLFGLLCVNGLIMALAEYSEFAAILCGLGIIFSWLLFAINHINTKSGFFTLLKSRFSNRKI